MERRPSPMVGVGSWRAGARPNRLSVIVGEKGRSKLDYIDVTEASLAFGKSE